MKNKINKKQLGEYVVVGTWKDTGKPLGGMMGHYLNQSAKEAIYCASGTPRIVDFSGDEGIEFYVCKVKLTPIRRIFPQIKIVKVKKEETKEEITFSSKPPRKQKVKRSN